MTPLIHCDEDAALVQDFESATADLIQIPCSSFLGVCCLSRGLAFWLCYAIMVVAVAHIDANVCAMVFAMLRLQRLE